MFCFYWPGSSCPEPQLDQCWVGQTDLGPQSLLGCRLCCRAAMTSSTVGDHTVRLITMFLTFKERSYQTGHKRADLYNGILSSFLRGHKRGEYIIQFWVCKVNTPWFWSWGWRPHWVSVQERWPSNSCWVSWAIGSFLSAASAPWTWKGYADPAQGLPVAHPTLLQGFPHHF